MIIKQATQQLPPLNIKMLLKLGMGQAGRICPVQEADQRLKPLLAGDKRRATSRTVRGAAAAAPSTGCIFAVSLPGRQDLSARGVKFATTGVEIGGHAGHLRGRRSTDNADLDTRLTSPRPTPPTAKPRQTGQNTRHSARERLNPEQSLTPRPQKTATQRPVTAPNPVSTGNSLSAQPSPQVP